MSFSCYFRAASPLALVPTTLCSHLVVCHYFHLDAVQQFYHHLSDSSSVCQEFDTPLHLASTNGHLIVAELLIQSGRDVNTRNQKEETPLTLASAHGKLEIMRLLLTSGSNVNSQDAEDSTPLHRAA